MRAGALLTVLPFTSPYYWRINKSDWVSRVFLYHLFSFSFNCTTGGMACFLQPPGSTKGFKQVLVTKSLQRMWRLTNFLCENWHVKPTFKSDFSLVFDVSCFWSTLGDFVGTVYTFAFLREKKLLYFLVMLAKTCKNTLKIDTEGGTWALTNGPGYQRRGVSLSNTPQHPYNLITLS